MKEELDNIEFRLDCIFDELPDKYAEKISCHLTSIKLSSLKLAQEITAISKQRDELEKDLYAIT